MLSIAYDHSNSMSVLLSHRGGTGCRFIIHSRASDAYSYEDEMTAVLA